MHELYRLLSGTAKDNFILWFNISNFISFICSTKANDYNRNSVTTTVAHVVSCYMKLWSSILILTVDLIEALTHDFLVMFPNMSKMI